MTDYPQSTTSGNVGGLQSPKVVKVKPKSKPQSKHTMGSQKSK